MKTCFRSTFAALFFVFPLPNASAQEALDSSLGIDPVRYIQDDFYRNVKDLEYRAKQTKSDRGRTPGSGSIKIINLGEDLKVFLAKAENADPDTQLAAWNELHTKYPAMISDADSTDPEKKKALEYFMWMMPKIKDRMFRLFDAGPGIIEKAFTRFKEAFPDYSEDITVYLLPSSFTFDACAWPGAIAFGPDTMVALGETENSFSLTTAHEVFHTYSFSKIPGEMNTFAGPLWLEGSATYVSGFLNPGATETEMLLDQKLGLRCSDPAYVKNLAARYRPILPKSGKGEEAKAIRADWYQYHNNSAPETPSRSAYCLGLRVFRKLAATNDISLMMTWPEPKFSQAIDESLAELSAN
jgi:hypothetical protein